MATLTGAIGTGSKWLLDKIVGAIAATGINPNFLTFLGLVVNFGAAANFAVGNFRTGAIIIFIAGFLDMLDGQVARRPNRVTAFGAFYDSTLDRYADMALYMGLLVYYSVSGRTPYVVLAAVATAGSVMVSYARARAESLIPLCKVGFMERPERIVLLIIGGVFNRMGPVLWVIAVARQTGIPDDHRGPQVVLYLDSSALFKRYQNEPGTQALNARLREESKGIRSVFTSVLTYAEIHAVFARRARERLLSAEEAITVQDEFDADWVLSISPIELTTGVLAFVRNLVKGFPLRGADAIHLASALWLRDMARLGMKVDQYTGPLVFVSSDKQLAKAAAKNHLEVFNPETGN